MTDFQSTTIRRGGRLFVVLTIAIAMAIGINACSKEKKKAQSQHTVTTYTVTTKKIGRQLYFSGTIAPLHSTIVTSPIEGFVEKQYIKYGQLVKKGMVLFTLTSTKEGEEYATAVLDFLKAKKNYQESLTKFSGSRELWKKGIISKDAHTKNEDAHEEAYVKLLKSKHKLEKAVKLIDGNLSTVTQLNLGDKKAIEHIINKKATVKVHAPADGVALPANGDQSSNSDKAIRLGGKVTQGQVMLEIGDISGFSMDINVNEVNITQLKAGLPVTVTGAAFPEYTLKGVVENIDRHQIKKESGSSSSAASFPVRIVVKGLTKAERENINIGMSAKIAISLTKKSRLTVPINAIQQEKNHTVVKVIDKKTGKAHAVRVVTGDTTETDVIIERGLKAGDIIQVFN